MRNFMVFEMFSTISLRENRVEGVVYFVIHEAISIWIIPLSINVAIFSQLNCRKTNVNG